MEVTGDDGIPDAVSDDESLLRRCGKRDVRANGSVKKNAFIRTTDPLEISVNRQSYVPNPWFDIEDEPTKDHRLSLSTRAVRDLPNAEVRADKPPPYHAVIGCLLEGRAGTAVASKNDLDANEWEALVLLCEKLASQATSLGPPPER